jgi:DNA-binding YbaB/EbfC family protein
MKGNLSGLLQQAQKMQQEMQKAQEDLAKLEVTGVAAGGLVTVTMTGLFAVRHVHIDPSLLNDAEMLEDIVTAAINDAVNRITQSKQEKMAGMASGISLPPGFKLPF